MPLVLEGLVTTRDRAGALHLAPMGPHVEELPRRFLLRLFPTSETFTNLQAHPEGVLHISDDVLLFAQGAIGRILQPPAHRPAEVVLGYILQDACRAFEFRARQFDDSEPRVRIECAVVKIHEQRPFFGFNRARHAVLEAAILATRLHLIPSPEIQTELARLRLIVEKTGGNREKAAFDLLAHHVDSGPKGSK